MAEQPPDDIRFEDGMAALEALVARLDRRTAWELAVSAGHLYLTTGGEALDGAVEGHALASPGR